MYSGEDYRSYFAEDDDEPQADKLAAAREAAHMRGASTRAVGRDLLTPAGGPQTFGGGGKRFFAGEVARHREDVAENPAASLHTSRGAHATVQLGFAAHRLSGVNPDDFRLAVDLRSGGWKVAVSKYAPESYVDRLFDKIALQGPQGAGYMRVLDVLVPVSMSAGDRMALAQKLTA